MRWTAKRKAEVLAELEARPDASAEIMDRHGLSEAELDEWRDTRTKLGDHGLKATVVIPGWRRRGV